jgi:hypothetical protein
MIIKFMASDLTSNLVKNFKISNIKVSLLAKEEQNVEYLILNRDTSKNSIEFLLNF